MALQEAVDGRTERTGSKDEDKDEDIDAPCLKRLAQCVTISSGIAANFHFHSTTIGSSNCNLLADEQLGIGDDGDDSCNRTKNGRSLCSQEMCTDILYDQRDAARPKGQGDVLHDGRLVGQHKDDEGDEEEQRRELDDSKTCNLANHIGRS